MSQTTVDTRTLILVAPWARGVVASEGIRTETPNHYRVVASEDFIVAARCLIERGLARRMGEVLVVEPGAQP